MKMKCKRKLNMLEPGAKMCKAMFSLFAAGIALIHFQIETIGKFMLIASGAILILLLILLAIEQYQDNKQYLEAKKSNSEIK